MIQINGPYLKKTYLEQCVLSAKSAEHKKHSSYSTIPLPPPFHLLRGPEGPHLEERIKWMGVEQLSQEEWGMDGG